jgi:hypothetical protein
MEMASLSADRVLLLGPLHAWQPKKVQNRRDPVHNHIAAR